MIKIKKLFPLGLMTTVLLILSFAVRAQVTTNLVITPPYSPFFKDYVYDNKMLITLFSSTNRQVFLTASIKRDDNAVAIDVKDQYRPGIPVNLIANIPQTLSGVQLKNVYGGGTANDLILQGVTERELNYNQALPEGNYTICVRVKDFNTRQVLSEACRSVYVAYYEPPQIINPMNNSTVIAKTPQFVLTNWSPAAPGVRAITYRLKLVKLVRGINPLDALNNNVQVIIDKGNITSTTFPIDLASGYKLDTGATYAMQVTASSPYAFFKNGGRSEIVTFVYRPGLIETNSPPVKYASTYPEIFKFISPKSKKEENVKGDTMEVNNTTGLTFSWNWFLIKPAFLNNPLNPNYKKDTLTISDSASVKHGVNKYVLSITAASPAPGRLIDPSFKYLTGNVDWPGKTLQAVYGISKENALKNGFKDHYWYKAKVQVLNNLSVVNEDSTVDFMFTVVKDEVADLVHASITANILYEFKGYPEHYNATNSPFKIEVLKKAPIAIAGITTSINGKPYFVIASENVYTNSSGSINSVIDIPTVFISGDSLYYRLLSSNNYYITNHFPVVSKPANLTDTTMVNFGQMVAKTYGYSLKVYVNKEFTSYKIGADKSITLADNPENKTFYEAGNGIVYKANLDSAVAGLPIILYRKSKESYVPPVEGSLKPGVKSGGNLIEVARGVTAIEKSPSGYERAYVTFDKLLSSFQKGEEYYIVAIKKEKTGGITQVQQPVPNQKQGVQGLQGLQPGKIQLAGNGQSSGGTIDNSISLINTLPTYRDTNFVAVEMPFSSKVPNPAPADSLYRSLTVDYNLTSTKPPVSHVKGRLLYKWKSDKANQLRPLANRTFRIVVKYETSPEGTGFIETGPNTKNETYKTPDDGVTMATGKTDEQGNFEVEVVNINKKGLVANGKIKKPEKAIIKDIETPIAGGGIKGLNVVKNTKDQRTDPDNPWMNIGAMNGAYDTYTNQQSGVMSHTDKFDQTTKNNGLQQITLNPNLNVQAGNGNTYTIDYSTISATPAGQGNYNTKTQVKSGPTAPEEFEDADDYLPAKLYRHFLLIVDDKYVNSGEVFDVQPFEITSLGDVTCTVREFKLVVKVSTADKSPIDNAVVSVFRSLDDKPADLPAGEGDGKYTQSQLVNSSFNGTGFSYSGESWQKNMFASYNETDGSIFKTTFEHLWSQKALPASGVDSFPALLEGFGQYYVEVSSRRDQGLTRYTPAIFPLNITYSKFYTGPDGIDYIERGVTIKKAPSRVAARLMDASTKLPVKGYVTIAKPSGICIPSDPTDEEGYAEYLADADPLKSIATDANSQVKICAKAPGYNEASYQFPLPPSGAQKADVINLQPAGMVLGQIVSADEKGKPVPAYIRIPSGTVKETYDALGHFWFLLPNSDNIELEILPKDVGYFEKKITVNLKDKKIVNLTDTPIKVFRRKHRIRFVIRDTKGASLAGATIAWGDSLKTTNSNGYADAVFENVSVNNYSFVVKGPNGFDYIPVIKNIVNEESEDLKTEEVILEKGSVITGKVTLDGAVVKHAKVYIDAQQSLEGKGWNDNLLTTYTDADGTYSLKGIPVTADGSIDVVATLDTSFTVAGDRQKVSVQNKTGTAPPLALTSYNKMLINDLYGFPLSVEKLEKVNDNEVKVSGIVHWKDAISDFTLNDINKELRVEGVPFKSNNTKGVATADSVKISGVSSVTLRYRDKYNVRFTKLAPVGDKVTPEPLVFRKEDDHGVIKAFAQIRDNSFNYPQSYLNFTDPQNSFFFSRDKSNYISAVKSSITASAANNINSFEKMMEAAKNAIKQYGSTKSDAVYNLTNSSGKAIKFKFISMDATANPDKSYIASDGKIHLNIDVTGKMEHIEPPEIVVNLKDVVLDENKVYPSAGTNPITFKMEQWNVKVTDWSISTTEGGLVSHNGLITTSKLDIPFKTFALRNDLFLMDSFDVDHLQMAGGLIKLGSINSSNSGVVFDNKVGSTGGAHWRFSMSGTGKPVAKFKVPALSDSLGLDYVQILSNDEFVFQMDNSTPSVSINGNSLAKFSPSGLTNNPDNLLIRGVLNIPAPRLGDMTLDLNFSGENGSIMKIGKVAADVEAKGYVHFKTDAKDSISIKSDEIKITGYVQEFPKNSFGKMRAVFTALGSSGNGIYSINLIPKDQVPLGAGGKILTIDSGGIKTENKDWGLLTYSGIMTGDPSIKPLPMNFKVIGDVSVDANGVKLEGISTPFGQMQMMYDFNTSTLLGKIDVKDVFLGPGKINGAVEMLLGSGGFYIAGGGTADVTVGNPFVDGTYNLGFLTGSYTINDALWTMVTAYKQEELKNNCFRAYTNDKITGFYFSVDKIVFDESHDFDFVIVSGYVAAKAVVGVDLWASFGSSKSVGVGVKVLANAKAGLGAVTGTSMSGEAHADAALTLSYNVPENPAVPAGLNANGNVDIGFTAKITQSLIATTVSVEKGIGCRAQGGTDGFDFEFTDGNKQPDKCFKK